MAGDCYCLDTYHAGDLAGAANVNIITCTRLSKLVSGTDGLRFHASIPLYAEEETSRRKLGVLNVASPDWRKLSAHDLQLLHTVGDLLSIAIERAQLFARSIQLGAAEERNRLAREIHDTLAQGLSAITLHLETADALLEANAQLAQVRTNVQQALSLTRRSLDDARRSVLDLRAAPLEGCSLPDALSALVEAARKRTEQMITFTAPGDYRPLPVHLEVGLYRMAQEALNNALRHATAHQIDVVLTIQPAVVELLVKDDGRGFHADQVTQGHFGLIGLNERSRLLGGTLTIESCPGVGTKIVVSVPLL